MTANSGDVQSAETTAAALSDAAYDQALARAKARVAVKKGFYAHALTYAAVIGFLFVIDLFADPGNFWVQWPALAWGVFVFMHWLRVFKLSETVTRWEERAIDKELQRELTRNH